MSDENTEATTAPDDAAGAQGVGPAADPARASEASQAWSEVVSGLDGLGEALGRWVKAAVNDPDNRRRADELSSRLEGFVSQVGTTIQGAASSEVGESFREAAEKTGDAFRQAGEKISDELGPRLSGAFRSAADRLGKAAGRMEERTQTETTPPASEEPGESGETNG